MAGQQSNLRYRWGNHGSIVVPATGGKQTQKLNRGPVIREIALRTSMTFGTLTAANNTLAKVSRGDEWGFFNDIRLVGGSSEILRQFSGDILRMRNLILGEDTYVSHQLGDAVSGTDGAIKNIDNTIVIPMWSPDGMQPIDTCLDTTRYSEVRLEVTSLAATGAAGGPISTNATLSACTMDIHCYQHEGVSPQDGVYGAGGPFTNRVEYVIPGTLANNTDTAQDIPRGPVYRGFLVNIQDNGAVPKDDGIFCTNIKLKSGSTVIYDRPWKVAMQRTWNTNRLNRVSRGNFNRGFIGLTGNNELFNEASTTVTAGATQYGGVPQFWQNQYEKLSGWAFIDLCPDGYFSEGLDTFGWGDFQMILSAGNNAGNGKYNILPIQLFPPRTAAA